MIGQLRRNWNAANARKANGPFVALFDGPGGVDNAVKGVRIIDDCAALRDEVERLYDLGVATEGRAEEAEAEVTRLRVALADCQRERTRNADAAARAIDELAANRV